MATPLKIPVNGGGIPIDLAKVAETGVVMQMPLRIGKNERSLWLLPIEPQVAVRCRNSIAVRNVAKQGIGAINRNYGSVKELWAKGDYEVIISGMLHNHVAPDVLPADMITKLDALCSLGSPVVVECALLGALGVSQLAIMDWQFDPTPGIENQSFVIKAISDNNFNLLIEK